mgnify:CR=1 FL=1
MKWFLFLLLVPMALAMPNPSAILCLHSGYSYDLNGNCYTVVNDTMLECDAWDYYNKCYGEGGVCEFECPETEPDWTGGANNSIPPASEEPQENETMPEPEPTNQTVPERQDYTWTMLGAFGLVALVILIAFFFSKFKKPKKKARFGLNDLGDLD